MASAATSTNIKPGEFITTLFDLKPIDPGFLPEIQVYMARPDTDSRIATLADFGLVPKGFNNSPNNRVGCYHYGKVYPGGVYLARYILDHPKEFEGKNLTDGGSGSGVVPIAGAMVGANVTAVDDDPLAIHFIQFNATANNVTVRTECRDVMSVNFNKADIITAADVFGADLQGIQVQSRLLEQHAAGKTVYAFSSKVSIEWLSQHAEPLPPARIVNLGGERYCAPLYA